MKTSTSFVKPHVIQLNLGTWLRDTTLDGRSVHRKFDLIGDNQILETQQLPSSNKTTSILRQFSLQGMKVTLKMEDVVATSNFTRLIQ